MPWIYEQCSGKLYHDDELIGVGYSGAPSAKNVCEAQDQHNVGPIPVGTYTVGPPRNLDGGPHGPYVLPLVPDPANQMFGRSGFLIHGDNVHDPGTASEGCVIMARDVRTAVWASGDLTLNVIAKKEDNGPTS